MISVSDSNKYFVEIPYGATSMVNGLFAIHEYLASMRREVAHNILHATSPDVVLTIEDGSIDDFDIGFMLGRLSAERGCDVIFYELNGRQYFWTVKLEVIAIRLALSIFDLPHND